MVLVQGGGKFPIIDKTKDGQNLLIRGVNGGFPSNYKATVVDIADSCNEGGERNVSKQNDPHYIWVHVVRDKPC